MRLSLDDFYLDRSNLSLARRARLNFDHPRAIDWERLERVLEEFRAGKEAAAPRYDFATHSRRSGDARVPAARWMIVEGLWLFRRPELRARFALKVFIRMGRELGVERRVRRDVAERGRTEAQVMEQWTRHTEPMFAKFVAPQEKLADVVLEAPVSEEDASALAERLAGQDFSKSKEKAVGI